MTLAKGQRLAQYEILEPIGAGGMGEVYRARDAKLGRDVAVKVLPGEFSQDTLRLERFEREARLLAQLNHANVATLHGLEEVDGQLLLVMELVDGDTLAERIAKGAVPFDEAIPLFTQIAEGLAAAHDKEIVHRDLKPANIKIGLDGKPKILDFGLAKAFTPEVRESGKSESPTVTRATADGVILGTASYMSPEQARGKFVDKRTDIWAFGCCLYEALTGRRAFDGETVTDVLAAVISKEPDWGALRHASHRIERGLKRCLRKDASRRFHDIADVRIELEEDDSAQPVKALTKSRAFGWALIAALVVALLVWSVGLRPQADPQPVQRFSINLPGFTLSAMGSVVLSPDASRLVYTGGIDGAPLYIRSIDEREPSEIPGTSGARQPFFSPDGSWLGFFADGKLKKASLAGGPTQTLCEVDTTTGLNGGAWANDETIYFAQATGLYRTTAMGGTPELLARLDRQSGEREFTWPEALPGGRGVLFTVEANDRFDTHVYDIATGERRLLVAGGTNAMYVPTGHIVYVHEDSIEAARFDLAALETGPSIVVAERVSAIWGLNQAYTFSQNGLFAYVVNPDVTAGRELVWVDRQGVETSLTDKPSSYGQPRISPDGRKLAMVLYGSRLCYVWTYDLERGAMTRVTFEGDNHRPIWTPDGEALTYYRREGALSIYTQPADGSGSAQLVHAPRGRVAPGSWSPDGNTLVFFEADAETGLDLWVIRDGEEAQPFLKTPFVERNPEFSPDGAWIAYQSNESGRNEVYVRPYPGPGRKVPISIDGGVAPRWSASGNKLFFRGPLGDEAASQRTHRRLMEVAIQTDPEIRVGRPRLLFDGASYVGGDAYDVASDGERFVMIKGPTDTFGHGTEIRVVVNWFDELKRLIPVD